MRIEYSGGNTRCGIGCVEPRDDPAAIPPAPRGIRLPQTRGNISLAGTARQQHAGVMRGIIYSNANPPADPFYKLSDADLRSLVQQAVGLPIRIEHETHDVGRVVSASYDGANAEVEWEFNESASGWAAEKLVELQQIKELSLKHVEYHDGKKKPLEVSLVRKGARPATQIMTPEYKAKQQALGNKSQTRVVVMASEAAVPEIVPAADAAAAVPVVPDIAPAAGQADEPASKRVKYDTPLEFINTISTKISDVDTMQLVADYIGSSLEANLAQEQEIKSLKEAKAILEQAQSAHVGASKNVVSDITRVLSDLYSKFATETQVSEDSKTAFMDSLCNNTAAMEFVRPILVAASAIHQVTAQSEVGAKSAQLKEAYARLGVLQNQIGAARKMAPAPAAPAVQPAWATLSPPAAAPPAAQQVMVAASNAAAPAAPPKFRMPDIIGSLTSFKEQGSVGNFTPNMLSKRQ